MTLVYLGATLGACNPPSPESTASSQGTVAKIESVEIQTVANTPLAREIEIQLSKPAPVSIEHWQENGVHFTRDYDEISDKHLLPLISLRADSETHVVVHMHADSSTISSSPINFRTEPLPFEPPFFEVLVPKALDGTITLFPATDEFDARFLGIDREGEVVWMGRYGELSPCGTILEKTTDGLLFDPCETESGDRHLIWETGAAHSLLHVDKTMHHDVTFLPNGNLVFLSRDKRAIDSEIWGSNQVLGDTIVEVDPSGTVVWEWNSFDYLDTDRLPDAPSRPKNGEVKWTHANSVQYLPDDDQFVVSFRNQNFVLVIDRSSGEIVQNIGEDGDYSLLEGEWFKGQHDASILPNGDLLLFDNGYTKPPIGTHNSRVVRYAFDSESMTADEVWSHDLGYNYRSGGGVLVNDDGSILISAGGVREKNAPIFMMELDENYETTWSIQVPKGSSPSRLYRANQLDPYPAIQVK